MASGTGASIATEMLRGAGVGCNHLSAIHSLIGLDPRLSVWLGPPNIRKGYALSQQAASHIWHSTLVALHDKVLRPSYDTWLRDTTGLFVDDSTLYVGAPNAFAVEWLEKRIYSVIEEAVETVADKPLEIRFQVAQREQPEPSSAAGGEVQHGAGGALLTAHDGIGLNPRLNFESFVVGKSNELAQAAARAVARGPGSTFNPLMIYSSVGLGKTHLVHAIGHVANASGLNVLYGTAERFTNEFIQSIQRGQTEDFRQKYRQVDVLLIDDIQFIAGKGQSQEAFFHTFNELHTANRQIVVTSDRPPKALTLIEDRLRSRFEGGLLVDIKPPALETRMAILHSKLEELGTYIPADVLEFIARRVYKNVRELEGSLNRVLAYAGLLNLPVTADMAAQVLADILLETRRHAVAPEQVISTVASFYEIDLQTLTGRRRDKHTALARQVAMYLLKEEAQRSLSEIGRLLGGKDHTTVIHGCSKIAQEMESNNQLRADVLALQERLHLQ